MNKPLYLDGHGPSVHWTRPFNVRSKLLESMRHYHKSISPDRWFTVWKFMDSNTEFIEVVW